MTKTLMGSAMPVQNDHLWDADPTSISDEKGHFFRPSFFMRFFRLIFPRAQNSCFSAVVFLTIFLVPKSWQLVLKPMCPEKAYWNNKKQSSGNAGDLIFTRKWHFCARLSKTSKMTFSTKNMKKQPCRKIGFSWKSRFSSEINLTPIQGHFKNRVKWDKLSKLKISSQNFQFSQNFSSLVFPKTTLKNISILTFWDFTGHQPNHEILITRQKIWFLRVLNFWRPFYETCQESKFLIFRISRLSPKGVIAKKDNHFYATKKTLLTKISLFDLLDRKWWFSSFFRHTFLQIFSPFTKFVLVRMIAV